MAPADRTDPNLYDTLTDRELSLLRAIREEAGRRSCGAKQPAPAWRVVLLSVTGAVLAGVIGYAGTSVVEASENGAVAEVERSFLSQRLTSVEGKVDSMVKQLQNVAEDVARLAGREEGRDPK